MRAAVTAFLVLAAACRGGDQVFDYEGAQLEVSHGELVFSEDEETQTVIVRNVGDRYLGIEAIRMASATNPKLGHAGAFRVRWGTDDVYLPSEPEGDELTDTSLRQVLPPDALIELTVAFTAVQSGTNLDGLLIETASGTRDDLTPDLQALPDQDDRVVVIGLEAQGSDDTEGWLHAAPADLGWVWPGDSAATATIDVINVGLGPVTVTGMAVAEDCPAGFSIDGAPSLPRTVAAGDRTWLDVAYAAMHDDEAHCTVEIATSASSVGTVEVDVAANTGEACPDGPPTVEIVSPEPGDKHAGTGALTLELKASDAEQPADTLACYVRSERIAQATLASCSPSTGLFTVDVPVKDYPSWGVDVLEVEVVDACGQSGRASVTVAINSMPPSDDEDGDGVSRSDTDFLDCYDLRADSYPFAAEQQDGIDNDCDGIVDETTPAYDDDGDGMSEEEGDCDDADVAVYAGAPETADGRDEDCDGVIDEGTVGYDDDGDGLSEQELDCDDEDADIAPWMPELCGNGVDDDCDGLKDSQQECVDIAFAPVVPGGLRVFPGSVEPGGTATVECPVFDGDGDAVERTWTTTGGGVTLVDEATGTWTAPDWDDESDRAIRSYTVTCTVMDADGEQAWASADIAAYPPDGLEAERAIHAEALQGAGCRTVPSPMAPAFLLALLATLAAPRARARRA